MVLCCAMSAVQHDGSASIGLLELVVATMAAIGSIKGDVTESLASTCKDS